MVAKSRRPNMVWVPTAHGEDECTRVEDHPPWDVVAAAPGLNPSHLDIPRSSIPSLVQPLPRRPNATPAPALEDMDDEETSFSVAVPADVPAYRAPAPPTRGYRAPHAAAEQAQRAAESAAAAEIAAMQTRRAAHAQRVTADHVQRAAAAPVQRAAAAHAHHSAAALTQHAASAAAHRSAAVHAQHAASAPAHHSAATQAQPSHVQQLFVPHMHAPLQRAAVVPTPLAMSPTPAAFYSYAEACAQPVDSTMPVAPLPFAELATNSFPRSIPRWSKIAMPIGGVAAIALFVSAFFATRDSRPELPHITSTSRAEAPAVVAAAAPAPAGLPADSHWKPRTVVPTVTAEAPRAEAKRAEIGLGPSRVKAPTPTPIVAAQSAPRERVAPIAAPPRTTVSRVTAQAPRADEDPVRAERAKPMRVVVAPRANGPGKAVVTSDTPSLVYIDGRPTGLRTPTTINLAPGPHKITLVAVSSKRAKTVDLDIRSGTSIPVHREFGGSPSSASGKGRQLNVDTSSALGNLRPRKAW
ncbi:MAG: PEGA domain-containing protein [Kofleriaceae bacterium]|nr:PEGA domain-containing protein [Kofleriaceae bacterium]